MSARASSASSSLRGSPGYSTRTRASASAISSRPSGTDASCTGAFSARARHVQALARVQLHLEAAQARLRERVGELCAEELHLAQQALSEITGEFRSDDLLGRIFSSFCIGK